jgi:hypothetical protein
MPNCDAALTSADRLASRVVPARRRRSRRLAGPDRGARGGHHGGPLSSADDEQQLKSHLPVAEDRCHRSPCPYARRHRRRGQGRRHRLANDGVLDSVVGTWTGRNQGTVGAPNSHEGSGPSARAIQQQGQVMPLGAARRLGL